MHLESRTVLHPLTTRDNEVVVKLRSRVNLLEDFVKTTLPVKIDVPEVPLARHQHMSNINHWKHIGFCATLYVIVHRLDLEMQWCSLLSSSIDRST